MEDYLAKVTPFLDTIRTWIMKGAEFVSGAFDLDVSNVYFFLTLIISILLSKKILEFFYTTLDGRKLYWLILAGCIFWGIKYLGIN